MFEYRLLPAPAAAKKAKGLKAMPERFAHALTEMLNIEAKSGWDFVRQESFSVEEKSGMLQKVKTTELTYLVFRRDTDVDSVPLDQKLENLKNKRARTMIKAAVAAPVVASVAEPEAASANTYAPPAEPSVAEIPVPPAEPFPEPMPAYVPEEPEAEAVEEEVKLDTSRSLPFPGPSPTQTMGMTGGNSAESAFSQDRTLNYDHSKGTKGASVDAPILGPAKRE